MGFTPTAPGSAAALTAGVLAPGGFNISGFRLGLANSGPRAESDRPWKLGKAFPHPAQGLRASQVASWAGASPARSASRLGPAASAPPLSCAVCTWRACPGPRAGAWWPGRDLERHSCLCPRVAVTKGPNRRLTHQKPAVFAPHLTFQEFRGVLGAELPWAPRAGPVCRHQLPTGAIATPLRPLLPLSPGVLPLSESHTVVGG